MRYSVKMGFVKNAYTIDLMSDIKEVIESYKGFRFTVKSNGSEIWGDFEPNWKSPYANSVRFIELGVGFKTGKFRPVPFFSFEIEVDGAEQIRHWNLQYLHHLSIELQEIDRIANSLCDLIKNSSLTPDDVIES